MFTTLEERKKHGFTLVELVVVIGIMSVLSAVLIPALIHYAEDSRMQRDDSAMAEIVAMTKTIMDSNIEAYDELYSIGQYIADGDDGVYIIWKDMGEAEGYVPYVLGERLEDVAPVFYSELTKTLEGPVQMQSGSYRDQYFVVTLQKDDDDELRWVSGDWSLTETQNNTNGTYVPVEPDVPNIPNTPLIPDDIPNVPPVEPDVEDENAPVSQPEDEKKDKPKATGSDPKGITIAWNGEYHELITPGTTNQGTYYYKLSNSPGDLWQSGPPKARDVGDYQISYYIKGNNDYQDSDVSMLTALILPIEPQFTPPTGCDAVYTGDLIELIDTKGTTTPADKVYMVYSLDKITWDQTPPSRSAVGTYIVYYKLIGSPEIVQDNTVHSVTAIIRPWQGNFTMPSAANPTYQKGVAQKLLNAGTAPDGCTIYYRTEAGTWNTAIPTAEEAGKYTVYYKIDGGDKYTSVGETAVQCEIKKANPILTLSSQRTIFMPPNMSTTINVTNTSDGAIKIFSNNEAVARATWNKDKTAFVLEGVGKGSATITISIDSTNNYNAVSVEHVVEVTIGAITAATTDGKATYTGLPTDGGAKVFVTTPESGYTIRYREYGSSSWKTTMPKFTNAGYYTIEYSITAEGFSPKTGTVNILIEKATASDSTYPIITGYEWIYGGGEYTPSVTNLTDGDGSPNWQFVSAQVTYSTFDSYAINEEVKTLPSIGAPGELRLSNFVFRDTTGNHENITVNRFALSSKVDGTLTNTSALTLMCYDAEGDENIYYKAENGVLYLRKTSRAGYHVASLNNDPVGNMFLGDNTTGITTVHIETTLLPVSMKNWFCNLTDLTKITYNVIDGEAVRLDTQFTTTMEGLFKGCTKLKTNSNGAIPGLDLSTLNTTQVTSFKEMFAGCTSIETVDVSKLNCATVLSIENMFNGCTNLKSINLANFNTSSVVKMDGLFANCSNLKALDLTSITVAPEATMNGMFDNTVRLETVAFGPNFKWNTLDGHLPAISNQYVTAADGKWYDITNANAYTPAQVADLVTANTTTKTYSSVPYYWLDMINGMRDGIKSDTLEGLATVDVYIDDKLVQKNVIDWYQPYKYGTKYEFRNLTATSNLGYKGLLNTFIGDELSGVVTHTTVSWLKFETISNEFQYTGNVQTFTASVSGYYQVEVWGAQGGDTLSDALAVGTGAAGGYSKGNVYLQAGQTIYISIGGKGGAPTSKRDTIGGWNGGGNGTHDHNDDDVGGAGGGCTSIQLSLIGDGQLKNYVNNQDQVVIVAGGGSGSLWQNGTRGGVGGGVNGGVNTAGNTVSAATQTSGYAFGQGESAVWPSDWAANYADSGLPGGGGGWYGGYTLQTNSPAAGGGSGYIGGVKHGSTISGIRKGNGLAKITYSGMEEASTPTSQTFEYTGDVQQFTVPISGYYKLETWGAEGGLGTGNTSEPGRGGYTAGITYLTQGTVLYVYVGEHGIDQFQSTTSFNGGGAAYGYTGTSQPHIGGRGGGATDIRLTRGTSWDDVESLKTRIIVAGGGGGAQSSCGNVASAGHGGGLTGVTSFNMGYTWSADGSNTAKIQPEFRERAHSTGGTQISGGVGHNVNDGGGNTAVGKFGIGAASQTCASGGGGGWYGGGSAYTSGGGGGSSYITGYPGCDTTYRNLQGTYTFTNTTIISGLQKGNGQAKITYMGDKSPARGSILTIDNTISDLGTFDLYIDGQLVGTNIANYCGEISNGARWEMKPIVTKWKYWCAQREGLMGVLSSPGTVKLHWEYKGDVTDFGTLSDGNGITAGQEVLWKLENNLLTIYPANSDSIGLIRDVTASENAPWWKHKTSITMVQTEGNMKASRNLCRLFYGCSNLTSINLNTVDVTNTSRLDQLFSGCSKLTTFDGFTGTAYIESYNQMFLNCSALTSINLNGLNALASATQTNMFAGVPAANFNKIHIPSYWFFSDHCGFDFDKTNSWKNNAYGTFSTSEFKEKVRETRYSGVWYRVS